MGIRKLRSVRALLRLNPTGTLCGFTGGNDALSPRNGTLRRLATRAMDTRRFENQMDDSL